MDFDEEYSDSNDTLLTMSFNQDGGCLAVGTGSGFRICNVNPYQETFRRNLGGGGGSSNIEGGKILYFLYNCYALRPVFSTTRYAVVAFAFEVIFHLRILCLIPRALTVVVLHSPIISFVFP